MNTSRHTREGVMSNIWTSHVTRVSHIWTMHVTHMSHVWASLVTRVSHIWTSHVTHMQESPRIYERVMSHVCHAYERIMLYIQAQKTALPWLLHVCDMAYLHVAVASSQPICIHDSFVCVTHVWHESFMSYIQTQKTPKPHMNTSRHTREGVMSNIW